MRTNLELVSSAEYLYNSGANYWYGCFGQTATEALYKQKKSQYPSYYKWKLTPAMLGKPATDCVGVFKNNWWTTRNGGNIKYNAAQDLSANGLYNKATKKGAIKNMPEIKGLGVYKKGHVGVYIGGGVVIEARGHKYGVIKSKLNPAKGVNECGWTHYFYSPFNEYISGAAPAKPSTPSTVKFYPRYTGRSLSIVDALYSLGINSSYAHRKQIAAANGIKNFRGTARQNTDMLNMLKAGKLKRE